MTTSPRVLVVIPAHNEEESLPRTLEEIRARAPGVDLLVVDDGSRDGTVPFVRERFPEASIYNRLCQMEWDRPAGETEACGGVAMMRVSAFQEVGGFREGLPAGEEPELCLRLRKAGWRIWRDEAPMATHDAAMLRFSQWWRRAVRAGHGYAQNAALHGRSSMRHRVRETRSIWFWGLLLPGIALALVWPTGGWSLLLTGLYVLLGWRIYRHMPRRGFGLSDARLYASFCVLAKFPQLVGQVRFHVGRWRGSHPHLIEYKDVPAVSGRSVSGSET